MTPKLYHGHMLVPEWNGQRNVFLILLHGHRQNPAVDYAQVIEGYDALPEEDRIYPITYVDELMTQNEAEAVQSYMAERYGWDVTLAEQDVPVPANEAGFSAIPGSRLNGIFDFEASPETPLPFPIMGYYDLRQE